jgi:hypothetical protein
MYELQGRLKQSIKLMVVRLLAVWFIFALGRQDKAKPSTTPAFDVLCYKSAYRDSTEALCVTNGL